MAEHASFAAKLCSKLLGVDGVVGVVGLVWRKKLNVTPKKEKKEKNNNFGTTRPALLVKMAQYNTSKVAIHVITSLFFVKETLPWLKKYAQNKCLLELGS